MADSTMSHLTRVTLIAVLALGVSAAVLGVGQARAQRLPDVGPASAASMADARSSSDTGIAASVADAQTSDTDIAGSVADARSSDTGIAANRCEDDGCLIAYMPYAYRPPVPPVCSGVLVNGDFEQGPGVGWTEESAIRLPVVRSSLPRNGSWGAWLGGYDLAIDVLEQIEPLANWPEDIGRKGDLLSAELSFSWRVHSAEDPNRPVDLMSVTLSNPDGFDLDEIVMLSSANERRIWRTYRTDVTHALRRRDNRLRSVLRFEATTDHDLYTSWYIDDVQITVCVRGLDAGLVPPTPQPAPLGRDLTLPATQSPAH